MYKKCTYFLIIFIVSIFYIFNFTVIAKSDYKEIKGYSNVPITKELKVKFNKKVQEDSLNNDNMFVQDSKGENIPVKLELGKNKKYIIVNPPKKGYKYNEKYTLYIKQEIKDANGNEMKDDYIMNFTTESNHSNEDLNNVNSNGKGNFKNLGCIEQGFQINKGIMYRNKKNEPVLYGGTIVMGGNSCSFFAFNTISKEFEKIISIPNCEGIVSMVSDGDFVYFGTYNKAYLYRYDIKNENLEKLSDIKNEKYIWDIKAYGNRVYISTSPRSRVYKFYVDEKTLEDLGSFSNNEYAKSIEQYNGKIYAGIGSKAALIEYDENSKTKKNILPSEYSGQFVNYLKIEDSKMFIILYPSYKVLSYDFNTNKFTERMDKISSEFYDSSPEFDDNFITFKALDGYIFHYDKRNDDLKCLQYNGGNVTCTGVVDNSYIASINQDGYYIENDLDGLDVKKVHLSHKGLKGGAAKPVCMYPYKDKIYFGGKMLVIYDINNSTSIVKEVPGEVKSMSILNNYLYTGNYANAKLWEYDESAIYDPNSVEFTNQKYFLKQIPKEFSQNRPSKMISNSKAGILTVLTEPLPGKYGGVVTTYNRNNGKFYMRKDVIPKQYMYCIDYDTNKSNIAYLGSSSLYTYGSKPLNENAHLVKYDVMTESKIFDTIPEANNTRITSIACLGNKVYCITNNGTLISIDANTGKVIKKVCGFWYREICASKSGNLYGLNNSGFWSIDKNTLKGTCLKNNLSDPSRLNKDIITGKIYFYDNLNLWCYEEIKK